LPDPRLLQFRVEKSNAGQPWRLAAFLLSVLPASNKTKIKQLLKFGSVAVNQTPANRHDMILKSGDTVSVRTDKKSLRADRAQGGLQIIYEDDWLLVVDKPPGLLTIATDDIKTRTAYFKLNEYLKNPAAKRGVRSERVFIVHRLDREASGLIIFAKTPEIKRQLQAQWPIFEKKYYAIVEGTVSKSTGTVESYLSQTDSLKVYSTDEPALHSKHAITHYRVLKTEGGFSLLEVTLETGRKHQIRVHLADLGHPIIGDEKYGSKKNPARRLGLHAYLLKITHPVTGEFLKFETELPGVLRRLTR
jgi:23S rRNA pseudouridine1911/1915/1917 synthase